MTRIRFGSGLVGKPYEGDEMTTQKPTPETVLNKLDNDYRTSWKEAKEALRNALEQRDAHVFVIGDGLRVGKAMVENCWVERDELKSKLTAAQDKLRKADELAEVAEVYIAALKRIGQIGGQIPAYEAFKRYIAARESYLGEQEAEHD